MSLKPGTKDWDDYYSGHPIQEKNDDLVRDMPGLLSEEGTNYHPLNFPVADTNFDLIELLNKTISISNG
jgi:hypothetical protein